MDLQNTGPNVPLPKDIQDALEGARNNVTVLNAEVSRLSKLKTDFERSIVALNTQSVEKEQIAAGLEERIAKATEEAEAAEARRTKALSDAIEAEDSLSESNKELEDKRQVVAKARESVEADTLELEKSKTVFGVEKDAWLKRKGDSIQAMKNAVAGIFETIETL